MIFTISTTSYFNSAYIGISLKFPHKCTWVSTASVVGAVAETNGHYWFCHYIKLNGVKTAAVKL